MDCVSCILMGMCMLCGPGFGSSEPGRPLTKEEFIQGMEKMLAHMDIDISQPSPPPPSSLDHYSDHRYSRLGIGKKNHRLDSFNFVAGIGKRRARNNLQQILTGSSYQDVGHKSSRPEEESIEDGLLSWGVMPAIPTFNADLSHYIFNHMMERAKVLKTQEFLDSERKKLQSRRERHGIDPFMSAIGIGK